MALICNDDGYILPETDNNMCIPNVRTSEIRRIFFALTTSEPFDDWSKPFEWVTRLSETSHESKAIRAIYVIGDKPAPDSTRVRLSMDRTQTVLKEHTINATIDEVNDIMHSFVRAMKNGRYFRMWYETTGGYMFGGNNGIMAWVNIDMVLARGIGELMVYVMSLYWKNLKTEERVLSPIFDLHGGCGSVDNLHTQNITAQQIVVAWDGSDAFGAYQVAITTTDLEPTTGLTLIYDVTAAFAGLQPETTYYIWVRPICNNGGIGHWVSLAVVTDTACAAPTGLAVTGSTGTVIDFQWDNIFAGIWEYVVNTTGVEPPGAGSLSLFNHVSLGSRTPCTLYHVFVRRSCGGGLFSTWVHTTGSTACCSAPNGVYIADVHATYAAILWDLENTANDMVITLNTTGIQPGDGTGTVVGEAEGILYMSPLVESTHYYVYIQRHCSNGVYSPFVLVEFDTVPQLPVINGLMAFYISYYGVHVTGNNVDIWDDLSPNANHLFFSAGVKAKLIPNNLATRPGILFNLNTLMRSAMSFAGASKMHIFFIENAAGATPLPGTVMEYGNADFLTLNDGFKIGVNVPAVQLKSEINGDVGYGKSELSTTLGTRIIHIVAIDKATGDELTTGYYAIGGTSGSTGYIGANNTSGNGLGSYPLYVGNNITGTQPFQGSMGFIAIYTRILSGPEQVQVINYMKAKYGF